MHPDLLAQLTSLGVDPETPPDAAEWAKLCDAITAKYEDHERQKYLLERTLETFEHSKRTFETTLSQTEESAQMVFQSTSDAIFVLDRAGRIKDVNASGVAILGRPEEDLLGKSIFAFATFSQVATEREFSEQLGRGAWRDEHATLTDEEAKETYLSCSFAPVEPQRGRTVRRVICSMRNVTTQRVYAQQLETLNEKLETARDEALTASEAKSQFLANMSHELRTPLNAIMGYAELLHEELEHDPSAEAQNVEDLSKILGAAKHLLSLINDLLDLSKIEAGKFHMKRERIDLTELIEDCAELFHPMAKQNENRLVVELDDELGWVRGDYTRLKQVLVNLLSNACKFTEGGTINLSAKREPRGYTESIIIRVSDTGIGMEKRALENIFKAFVQADESSTRAHGGTGLGLTIARRLCRMMGGDLRVESVLGEGSTFEIEMLAPSVTSMAASNLPQHTHEFEDAIVLLIDDDPSLQEIVRRQLANTALHLVVASDGAEGLMMARAINPDVIILDVLMPRMDGPQVLAKLREDPQFEHTPVVLISSQEFEGNTLALGVDDFLLKPLDRKRLLSTLARFRPRDKDRPHRILVVEDNEDVRDVLKRTLAGSGAELTEARDGVEGLERLGEQVPDLILLDLMMPRMDGFEFLSRVRATPRWSEVPIVILSAKTLDAKEYAMLERRTSRIITKGELGPMELKEEVLRLVERRPLYRNKNDDTEQTDE